MVESDPPARLRAGGTGFAGMNRSLKVETVKERETFFILLRKEFGTFVEVSSALNRNQIQTCQRNSCYPNHLRQ